MPGIHGDILRRLIEFIYVGQIQVEESNVKDILTAADRYLLTDLVKICESFCLKSMRASTAFEYWAFGRTFNLKTLRESARYYICYYFHKMVEHPSFLKLDINVLVEYLQDDHIECDNEVNVVRAIMKWITHDADERKKHFTFLMKFVRATINDSEVRISSISIYTRYHYNLIYLYFSRFFQADFV